MKEFWRKCWREMHREPITTVSATLFLVVGLLLITVARCCDFEPNPNYRPPAESLIRLGYMWLLGSLLFWLMPAIRVSLRERELRQQLKEDSQRQKNWYDGEVDQ